ncbi:hypothetical protein BDV06DRAFT_206705, partial [Aspergillus oleicola]
MSTFSSLPTYLIGALCLALGISGFIRPETEYPRFGLPLEPPASTTPSTPTTSTNNIERERGTVSPLIYIKSIREITYGLALIFLQYQGQEKAITTLAGIFSLAGLGDGFVVWIFGGEEKWTAFNHWGTFVGLLGWAVWRGRIAA